MTISTQNHFSFFFLLKFNTPVIKGHSIVNIQQNDIHLSTFFLNYIYLNSKIWKY